MSEVLEGDYQGNAILIIRQTTSDLFPFQFGVKKARLIMEHLPEITAFLAKHSPDTDIEALVRGWARPARYGR